MNQTKHSNRATHYIDFAPTYVSIPTELIHDPEIKPLPFLVFAFIRSLCWRRELKDFPYHFGSQSWMGERLGISRWAVSTSITYLYKIHWVEKIRLGQGNSNIVVLLSYKGQKLSARDRQMIMDRVRLQQRKWKLESTTPTA